MNNKKICFITCVNNQGLYDEALLYINNLYIPKGYEIEVLSVKNASSITKAYNEAMNSSDAKYKVYLHQDVYITNKNFINDFLKIFNEDKKIGMIGVVGAKDIPTNGVWWEAKQKYGQVYDSHTGKIELLNFGKVSDSFIPVSLIDGLIMITQYDIPWREDIFDGWHFYDASQSIEFKKAGYEVVVPRQEIPWGIHDCGIVNISNGYNYYRKIFLNEYSKGILHKTLYSNTININKDNLPLVSILIPAYNQTKYLKEALESAINQTYPNIEIIIGDDSTNDKVENFIKYYLDKYDNIQYFKNKRKSMDYGITNVENLFKRSKGEYIAYLLHDDIFHKQKIEKMMKYFLSESNLSIVTSYRKLIDSKGNILEDLNFNKTLFKEDTKIKGIEMCKYIIRNTLNVIGELSTAMFKREYIEDSNVISYYYTKKIRCNGDMALWLRLLDKGDMIYISECLNYFRQHDNQNTHNKEMQLYGVLDNINILEEFYTKHPNMDKLQYRKDIINCYYRQCYILKVLDQIEDNDLKTEFISKFSNFLYTFLK